MKTLETWRFGDLVRALRERAELTQAELALKTNVSRSAVGNAENGRLPGRVVVGALESYFSSDAEALELAWTRAAASLPPPRRQRRDRVADDEGGVLLRRLRALRVRGRYDEAEDALRHALADQPEDPIDIAMLWQELGDNLFVRGRDIDAIAAYKSGIAIADGARAERIGSAMRDLLAGRLTRLDHFDEALELLDTGLASFPADAVLWRRRSIVLWYRHTYPDAYAAVTTAMRYGCPRPRALHVRGQILSEWGRYDEAVVELSEALAGAASFVSAAYAQSSRGHAYAGLGQYNKSEVDFNDSEAATPRNAWLHYFRGICYDRLGDRVRSVQSFERALEFQSPPLNTAKRLDVIERLQRDDT